MKGLYANINAKRKRIKAGSPMPKLKKKKKRLVESPAPVNNGYSRTLVKRR